MVAILDTWGEVYSIETANLLMTHKLNCMLPISHNSPVFVLQLPVMISWTSGCIINFISMFPAYYISMILQQGKSVKPIRCVQMLTTWEYFRRYKDFQCYTLWKRVIYIYIYASTEPNQCNNTDREKDLHHCPP